MTDRRPIIALTLGDCTGIGPEITARMLAQGRMDAVARLVLVGDRRVLARGENHAGVRLRTRTYPEPKAVDWTDDAMPLIDVGNTDPDLYPSGKVSAEAGRLAGDTLAKAIDFAKSGQVQAITFAPLNKRAMFDGGWKFPDEHKMFAHLLGHRGYFSEMNVLDPWWMFRVTSHIALRDVAAAVTIQSVSQAIRLAIDTMGKAGIQHPRLAVAALNPHAGENGLFGLEEIEIIRPAVEAMIAEGYPSDGPFPSDTVFLKAFSGEYDGILSMYHDQGQIATKLKGFNKGVTVTAGLDAVFTTPAHGTAFDIVGQGTAKSSALEAAVVLAAQLVR